MSLQTLAESTGLSIGYLSQLERGISTPTLRALTGLADALRVSTADLIRGDIGARRKTAPIITRSDERAKLKLWRSGIHKAIIAGGTPEHDARFSFLMMTLEPGADSGEGTYTHGGEEAGYVLSGRLSLTVGSDSWVLRKGDSFQFSSRLPHRFENNSRTTTIIIMVNLHQTSL
jgi:transcriptional regulator with XRE-family HTH domain